MFGDVPFAVLFNSGVTGGLPANTVQPSITAPPTSGQEAEVGNGEWTSATAITFTYQWQLNGVDILGATAKTILVLVGMIGSALRCIVKAINSVGFSIAITAELIVSA